MVAEALARALATRNIHYGWVMVGLTLAYSICTAAMLGIPSVLIVPMSKEFGWSLGELSAPLGLRMAFFGLMAPFAGALMLRYGQRAVVAFSAVLLVLGILLTIGMTEKWQMWLGLGVLMGVAPGMTALVMSAMVATRWFQERRGLALGILGTGLPTGQLIFLPPAAWLAEHYGWRAALYPSVAMILVTATAFAMLARGRPSDLGLRPYGDRGLAPQTPPKPPTNPVRLSFATLGEAVHSRVFWVLAFTFAVCGASSTGLTPHFVALCGDFNVSPLTSSSILALVALFDMAGVIGSGWLADRYDNRWLLSWYYVLRGLSLLWLAFSDFSFVALSSFAVFYGLDFLATLPPTVRLIAKTFGPEKAPIVFGWVFTAHQFGSGLMAFAAGQSRDFLATYIPAYLAGGAFCVLAALSLLLLRQSPGSPQLAAKPA